MNGNGQADAQVLCWPRKVLSADDLRRHLTSQRELQLLPRAIVTPLAADELKARGICVTWQLAQPPVQRDASGAWGYARERPEPAIDAAVQAVVRDGMGIVPLEAAPNPRAIAEAVARGQCLGVFAFCADPALVCCIANKVSGVRAAAVATPQAAARARHSLGANLLAIEMPGRTFFELRQMLRAVCGKGPAACPPALAEVLKELDGHAHR